jgi:prepilin-type processing-associated H-X9-DG protein
MTSSRRKADGTRPWRAARRRGRFRLRELLALSLLAPLTVTLLLPAVQAAREAARRMLCSNNLKMIGLGLMSHQDMYRFLPAGCVQQDPLDPLTANLPTAQGNFGWGVAILPMIEEQPLHDRLQPWTLTLPQALDMPGGLEALQQPIKLFRCPSAGNFPLNPARPFTVQSLPLAMSNYVASNGSGELRRDGLAVGGTASGLFYLNSKLPYGAVTDGNGNTIALGERTWRRDRGYFRTDVDYRAAVIYGTRGVREASQQGLADSLACGKYRLNYDAVDSALGLGQQFARRAFSSNHPGGAQFLMADGSTHFISDSVDADMNPATQTVNTEETVDSVWERLLHLSDQQSLGNADF